MTEAILGIIAAIATLFATIQQMWIQAKDRRLQRVRTTMSENIRLSFLSLLRQLWYCKNDYSFKDCLQLLHRDVHHRSVLSQALNEVHYDSTGRYSDAVSNAFEKLEKFLESHTTEKIFKEVEESLNWSAPRSEKYQNIMDSMRSAYEEVFDRFTDEMEKSWNEAKQEQSGSGVFQTLSDEGLTEHQRQCSHEF